MNLDGKIAVVTGGSRGIGRTISLRLAERGAFVYINYVSRPDAAEETLAQCTELGGKGALVQFDVADFAQAQEVFKNISSESGAVDILVNNAGITRDGLVPLMKEADWNDVIDTNLKGTFQLL